MSDRLRFLAVDDEAPALNDLVRMLRASEAVGKVDSATSGADALRRLNDSTEDYHGLFIDVRMPDLDGLELQSTRGEGTTVVMTIPKFRAGVRAA